MEITLKGLVAIGLLVAVLAAWSEAEGSLAVFLTLVMSALWWVP